MAPEQRGALVEHLGPDPEALGADDGEEALEVLASHGDDVSTVVIGESLRPEDARRLVSEAARPEPRTSPAFIVLAGGQDLSTFQELIDRDRLFFLSHGPPPVDEVADLIWSTLGGRTAPRPSRDGHRGAPRFAEEVPPPDTVQAIGRLARKVALQEEAAEVEEVLAEGLRELVSADRASCLFYDAAQGLLWSRTGPDPDGRKESASVGLASFALRAGRTVRAAPVGADPRWNRELDDPAGDGDEALLAVPVRTSTGRALGVLVAVRDGGAGAAFSDADGLAAEWLAEHVVSALAAIALSNSEGAGYGLEEGVGPGAASLYRRTALEEHVSGSGERGDVLRLSPAWTLWSYRLLVGILVTMAAFTTFARVPEYAEGPAIVRSGALHSVSALTSGTVTEVAVSPGQHVEPGELLVRLDGSRELAELERIESELELRILDRLRDPSDSVAAQALVGLRAQRELAAAALRRRSLIATTAGAVGEVRVREGQRVEAGQAVLTLSRQSSEATVVAFIPGRYRPLLEPGLPLRFELAGFPGSQESLTIEAVGDEIVGPREAMRHLGPELADAITLTGPVVLVEARMPAPSFQVGRRSLALHDGMPGRVDVRVRSEPLLFTLAPQLEGALSPDGT